MKMPFDEAISRLAPTDDVVNKPDHYMVAGIEVRDVQRELSSDMGGIQASDFNNAIKYLLRSPKKGKFKQDLMKCRRHLTWLIESLEQ
jgi:hypothetical protein